MTFYLLIAAALLLGLELATHAFADAPSFGDDLGFLKKHTDTLVLSDGDVQLAIAPGYQARVMTSTAGGSEGLSFGWINREQISAGKLQPHINVWGGEDRFWLGPEGGQYAIFFKEGEPFDLEHWQTPAAIDTDSYDLVEKTDTRALFEHAATLTNYSGYTFNLQIRREIRLLDGPTVTDVLGAAAPEGVAVAAYESKNRVTNIGKDAWTRQTGLLSIWILGMYNPTPDTTVVLPYHEGDEATLGPVVNDAYFGKVPADRLQLTHGCVFYKADGQMRGKIGLTPQRAKGVCGSYDAAHGVLTLVRYTQPEGEHPYVNSMWEHQDQPYAGDALNSYNDGPPEPGAKPLGPFYELETSSPAAELSPGQSINHTHTTLHLQGSPEQLTPISQAVLGVSIEQITRALP